MSETKQHTDWWPFSCLAVLCLTVLLFVCSGCNGDARNFTGVWDLCSMEGTSANSNLSTEDIRVMRDLGFETYLNIDEDGSLMLVNFDKAQRGTWEATDQTNAKATIDGQPATITIEDDQLRLIQKDITLVFERGTNEDQTDIDANVPNGADEDGEESEEVGTETRTSELSEMIVRGTFLEKPLTIVDDDICTIIVDGVGVDKWGDPGYNLQITNNSPTNIDVWIKDPFTVGDKQVRAYLFETVSPRRSVTAFIQFDTDQLGSSHVSALEKVKGTLLVDNNREVTIARYQIDLQSVDHQK